MGLGQMLHRAIKYDVTDTDTGESGTFVIQGHNPLAPDWSRGPYQGGMSQPGAWRAAVLLSDLLGSVPWQAFREVAGGPPEQIVPTPPLLDQPAPPDTRMTTFSSMALDLIWHGNAVALIADRNHHGWPTAMLPVPAEDVLICRVMPGDGLPFPMGTVAYGIGAWQLPESDPRYGTGQLWYSSDDVVHVKGPARPGALRGMGVIECHLNGTLKLAAELGRQAGSIADAAVPSVLIKSDDPDLTKPEADDLKSVYMQSQRTRQPAVMNANTTIEPLSWNPTQTQLLEARKFTLHEAALVFGLPLSFLGADQATRTYSNVEQESLQLLKYSLGGHLARFEQAVSLHFPRGTRSKANLDALLRADTLTRYQAHKLGIESGFLTDDEVRAIEDRGPLTPAQRARMRPAPAAPRSTPGAPKPPDADEPDDDEIAARALVWAAELDSHDRAVANELAHYWKHGEGRAKWVTNAHPWTALYRHLLDKVGPARAKRIASQWFRDVFGIWPGEREGANPVGKG